MHKTLRCRAFTPRYWFCAFLIWRSAQAEWPNEPKENANPINDNSEAAAPFLPLRDRAAIIIKNKISDIIKRNLYSLRFFASYIAICEILYKERSLAPVIGHDLCA